VCVFECVCERERDREIICSSTRQNYVAMGVRNMNMDINRSVCICVCMCECVYVWVCVGVCVCLREKICSTI
jgi:hypothetical protein